MGVETLATMKSHLYLLPAKESCRVLWPYVRIRELLAAMRFVSVSVMQPLCTLDFGRRDLQAPVSMRN